MEKATVWARNNVWKSCQITVELNQEINVFFGPTGGTQKAKVVKITKNGTVYVSKFRARSGRWTNPVRLYDNEMII